MDKRNNQFNVSLPDDAEYEDLSRGQMAMAIYDYVGGDEPVSFSGTPSMFLWVKPFHLLCPAEADDEISFNPDDIITHIEMIDEGWWKGQCNGHVGLFPAVYVQLL